MPTKRKAGKLQYYRSADGDWRWRLVATNGRTIADSGEGYSTRGKCIAAIGRLRALKLCGAAYDPAEVE